MKNNLEYFLKTIDQINESINILLEQGVIERPSGSNVKKEKFIVIEDGKAIPNDGKNYIHLKDAKAYKGDVKVGDEIEIEVIDFEAMDEQTLIETIREYSEDGKISAQDLQQIAIAAGSSRFRRTAIGMIKIGGKIEKAAKTVMLLKRYKKVIPHSDCYCARLFDENKDETVTPPKPDKSVYMSTVAGYLDVVQKQFEDTWDECEKNYPELYSDESKRTDLLSTCESLEGWYEDANSVLDKIISDLQQYFKITGIDVKNKKLASSEEQSIAKTIGLNERVVIHFEDPFKNKSGTLVYAAGSDKRFEIGTYKETGKTVKLIDGANKWYFEFQTPAKKTVQSGSAWPDDGTGNPDGTLSVSWKGYIVKYE